MASTTNDKRLTAIEKEKNAAIKESDSMYQSMINQSDGYFDKQVTAVENYGKTQQKNQEDQHKQAIAEIEQQKEYAHQDYLKEQTGAYVDWQKQSDQYGTNAEQMAASGLAHTGFSESSQVSMYNTYQNRVATARASYQRSVDSYNNAINNAILQNNSLLAEIAFNTLQTSLELSLQGFQYKNTLVQAKADAKRNISDSMWGRYTDTLSQINTENAQAEQIRQYNASLKEQQRQYNQDYKFKVKQYNEQIRQFNVEIARLKAQDKKENAYKIQQLELQKKQLAEEKRQFDANLAFQKKKSDVSSSGGSSSSSGSAKNKKSSSSSSKKSSSGSSSSKKTTSSKAKSSSNPQIDMNSVIALGYGPISASKLDSLVASGKVIQYVENGKVKFKNKPSINSKDSFKTFLPNTAKKFGLK